MIENTLQNWAIGILLFFALMPLVDLETNRQVGRLKKKYGEKK